MPCLKGGKVALLACQSFVCSRELARLSRSLPREASVKHPDSLSLFLPALLALFLGLGSSVFRPPSRSKRSLLPAPALTGLPTAETLRGARRSRSPALGSPPGAAGMSKCPRSCPRPAASLPTRPTSRELPFLARCGCGTRTTSGCRSRHRGL